MILFLDFDGVLHPTYSTRTDFFCFLPRLESVLHDFPTLKVVVSSDWRRNNSLDELRQFFSSDLRTRMIGVTPVIRPYVAGVRLLEATAWMKSAHYVGPWAALDDDEFCWSNELPAYVHCKNGFLEEEDKALRTLLFSYTFIHS
jgi:hypothetical protein